MTVVVKRTGAGRHARGWYCTMVTDGNRPGLDHRMTSLLRYQDTKDQRPMKTSPSPHTSNLWGRSQPNNRFFFLASFFPRLSDPLPFFLFTTLLNHFSMLTVVLMIMTLLSSLSISISTVRRRQTVIRRRGYSRDYVARRSLIFYLYLLSDIRGEGFEKTSSKE